MIRTSCCVGAGYVSSPTMCRDADRCPDVQVTVVDLNQGCTILLWSSSIHLLGGQVLESGGWDAALEPT